MITIPELYDINGFKPAEIPCDILKVIAENYNNNADDPDDLVAAVVAIHLGSVMASRYNFVQTGRRITFPSLIFDIIGTTGTGKSTILKYIQLFFTQCGLGKLVARPGASGRGVETSLKETPRGSVLIDEQSRTELSGSKNGINWEENSLITVDTIITMQESYFSFKALTTANKKRKDRLEETQETRCKRPAQSFIRCSQPKTWLKNVVSNDKAANGSLGRAMVLFLPQRQRRTFDEVWELVNKPPKTLLLTLTDIQKINIITLKHTGFIVNEPFDDTDDERIPDPTPIPINQDALRKLVEFEVNVADKLLFDIQENLPTDRITRSIRDNQMYACNRLTELVYRICTVLAACNKQQLVTPEIVEWSMGFVLTLKYHECMFYQSEIEREIKETDKENEDKIAKDVMARTKATDKAKEKKFKTTIEKVNLILEKNPAGLSYSNIVTKCWKFRNLDPDERRNMLDYIVAENIAKKIPIIDNNGKSSIVYILNKEQN
jgi:hypothetical protein